MHLSMHNWMRAEPIEVTIARLAKYKYESIEIGGEPKGITPKMSRNYWMNMVSAAGVLSP